MPLSVHVLLVSFVLFMLTMSQLWMFAALIALVWAAACGFVMLWFQEP
jgi:hypothetical protein